MGEYSNPFFPVKFPPSLPEILIFNIYVVVVNKGLGYYKVMGLVPAETQIPHGIYGIKAKEEGKEEDMANFKIEPPLPPPEPCPDPEEKKKSKKIVQGGIGKKDLGKENGNCCGDENYPMSTSISLSLFILSL